MTASEKSETKRPGFRRWVEPLLVALSYAVMAVAVTWPLALHARDQAMFLSGDTMLNAYLLEWGRHALLHAPLEIFSPNYFYPGHDMLCLSENMIFPALLTLPLVWLRNPILLYNVAMMGAMALNAMAMRWALRRWGLSVAPAWLGGAMFGFSPWLFGQLGHIQLFFAWGAPLTLAGVDGWIRGRGAKWAMLAGAALAAQFYSCVYIFYFTMLFSAPFAVVGLLFLRPGLSSWKRLLLSGLAGAAMLAVLIAPAYGPYSEVRELLGSDPNPLSLLENRGAGVFDYLRITGQNRFYGWFDFMGSNLYSDVPWEHNLWIGLTPWLGVLSLPLALWLGRKRATGANASRDAVILAAMLAAGGAWLWVISLGPVFHIRNMRYGTLPWYRWLHAYLPGFDAIRVPPRAVAMVALAASGLAALALEEWTRWASGWRLRPGAGRVLSRVMVVLAALAVMIDFANRPLNDGGNPDYERHRVVHEALARKDPGVILVLPLDHDSAWLSQLASTAHFAPLVNGYSGHIPPSNGAIMTVLGKPEWGDEQADLLRWLQVRSVVVDRRRAAMSDAPPPDHLETFLGDYDFLEAIEGFPLQEIDVYRLNASPCPREPVKNSDFEFWFDPKRPEPRILFGYDNDGGGRLLTSSERGARLSIRGYGADENRLWKWVDKRDLPQFLVDGLWLDYSPSVDPELWRQTKYITLKFRADCLAKPVTARYPAGFRE